MRLVASGVEFSYPGAAHHLYSGLSHEWRSGSLEAVVGPSGAGKSTLLDLLGKLREPNAGTVALLNAAEGEPERAIHPRQHRARCSWVLQANTVLSGRSVLENVAIGARFHGVSAAEARRHALVVLRRFNLSDLSRVPVNELSGGEQQRVTIARCLLAPADVILADEPTGNLDIDSTRLVASALRTAAEAGKIVIVATHDPELIERCDAAVSIRRESTNSG